MGDLDRDLEALGFRRTGTRATPAWTLQAGRYLSFTVHPQDDGSAIVSWEVAIGELVNDRGMQIGSNDPLNIFMFPQADARGPADATFVAGEVERTRRALAAIDLSGGEPAQA